MAPPVRTALVVDDNPDVRLLLATVLGARGFTVVEAAGGAEALAVADRTAVPDVVVLDVQMPEPDGWDTLAALRASPRFADVPVVVCTVKSSVADRVRAWKLGCDGYLVKPFDVDDLVRGVEAAIESRRAGREVRRRSDD
ncbi:MAG TPA: response regulator [Acidimicrobiales bacterium]|nr:response regulator [Acidimicrobiales bacterium]